jgi:hypothetical protein
VCEIEVDFVATSFLTRALALCWRKRVREHVGEKEREHAGERERESMLV